MGKFPRFYVPPIYVEEAQIRLTDSVVRHAVHTLRLREGDNLILFDGTGKEYESALALDEHGKYMAHINQVTKPSLPFMPKIDLNQAPIKKDRWEWLIEKGTELGVHAFIPMMTRYTEVDVVEKFEKKKERWEGIIQSTCEQCNRSTLSEIHPPLPFREALKNRREASLLCYEGKPKESLKEELAKISTAKEVSIFIGPVGGFSEEEIELAHSNKIPIVSLGALTLRAETAGIAAISIVSFWLS